MMLWYRSLAGRAITLEELTCPARRRGHPGGRHFLVEIGATAHLCAANWRYCWDWSAVVFGVRIQNAMRLGITTLRLMIECGERRGFCAGIHRAGQARRADPAGAAAVRPEVLHAAAGCQYLSSWCCWRHYAWRGLCFLDRARFSGCRAPSPRLPKFPEYPARTPLALRDREVAASGDLTGLIDRHGCSGESRRPHGKDSFGRTSQHAHAAGGTAPDWERQTPAR